MSRCFHPLNVSPALMSQKKLIKVLGYPAVAVAALILVVVATVYGVSSHRLQRKHVVEARVFPIATNAAALERGEHLVRTRGCADCHAADMGGAKVIDDAMAGVFHGPNITRGVGGLAAEYSEIDYVRAIRHGVARDGRALALMPSHEYAVMTDEDLGNMIAYLRTVPSIDRERGPVAPGPIIRLLMLLGEFKLAADEIDHSATQAASIVPTISVEYGKYVAASCIGCHGPNLSGGKIPGVPPDWPISSNLTKHPSARISQWTEAQFVEVLRTHKRPDGTELHSVMPAAFGLMTDVELKALWAYIESLPPTELAAR